MYDFLRKILRLGKSTKEAGRWKKGAKVGTGKSSDSTTVDRKH